MVHTPPEVELLAPAGNWECARAAVENGADAIYFGLDVGFNARARAANFHVDELDDLMLMLHRQAVRGYVTLNTLVFTDELPRLEENIRLLAKAGVDAVLVQDLGVVKLVKQICPELEVHASTQMTLTNAVSIEMARELGIARAVLARELSLKEIQKISSGTTTPIETFVHGALCVAYSGQCLTSESFGGRSANRGQCAQACRLPYDLFCDGEELDLEDVKYLVSPQDLAAHDLVPDLIRAGVCSLKIEGRLKTPEYVANVCRHYRAAIDTAMGGSSKQLTQDETRELELSFSRGFSPGWLEGCDHKRLVPGKSSSKRGARVGELVTVRSNRLVLRLDAPLQPGDGIVIEGDRAAGEEVGGRVYEVESLNDDDGNTYLVSLGRERLNVENLRSGLQVWKTDDPQLTKRLRKTFQGADPQKRVPVDIEIVVAEAEPIALRAKLGSHVCSVFHEHLPEKARKHPVSREVLEKQLGRLGGSVYYLRNLQAEIKGAPMVPHSVLGDLRKQLVEALDELNRPKALPVASTRVTEELVNAARSTVQSIVTEQVDAPVLRVLCRSLSQLESVIQAGIKNVIADFHDIREYKDAAALANGHGVKLELATLRIHKPGEDGLFHALRKHTGVNWLVRNLAGIAYCREHGIAFTCDFSLNVTNPLTAAQIFEWGSQRVTASYDLNRDQLVELAQSMPPNGLEVVIHQHMPMFHMEHCVFCSVLSPGKNKSDCGRPCDRHDVKLQDRVGAQHVLHADIGCRNTLYNANAQSGAEAVEPLLGLGVRNFRVELLRDAPAEEIRQLCALYMDLINGKVSGTEVWTKLKAQNRVGVTRGTLEQPRNPLAIL